MLQMSLVYIALCLLFQILADCQVTSSFNRVFHTATHVDNKLYILGGGKIINGSRVDDNITNDFFYLDVSVPFNTKTLSWKYLSNRAIPKHYGAAAVVGGVNNNILFLYGGYTTDTTMPLVSTFNLIRKAWRSPIFSVDARRLNLTGFNSNGKIYLWGGMTPNSTATNNMFITNTINFSFGEGSLIDAPSPRSNYGSALLPNQKIIYMGGFAGGKILPLDKVYIYDIINDKWSSNKTTGLTISERHSFSAVLGLDGQKIIIFGGITSQYRIPFVYENSLFVLNLNNFEWSVPKSSGDKPKPRIFHKANVIGKYMVISFGLGYDQSNESDILLLDISNDKEYMWTYDFNDDSSTTQIGNIIGAIIGSLLGVVLLISGGVFLRKWKNAYENNKIQMNPVAIDYF